MSKLTEKAMAQALMDLLKTRTLDKITIKNITDYCDLTRNTFYYHFHDIYDLLRWIFENKTIEIMNKYQNENDWEGGLTEALDYLYENQQMLMHINDSIDEELVMRFINEVMMRHAKVIVAREARELNVSPKAIRIAAEFYMNAAVGNAMSWIRGGMQQTPDHLGQIYNTLFHGTVKAVLQSAEKAATIK